MPASRAQQAKTAERRQKAIAMRLAGADWDTIAARLGYASKGAACTDVTRAMEKAAAEALRDADVLRHIELSRLDRLQVGLWTRAAGGELDAIGTVLSIIDRRVRLLGLNAPVKVEGVSLSAIEAAIAHLEALEEAGAAGALTAGPDPA
jgi:hypothetical protein